MKRRSAFICIVILALLGAGALLVWRRWHPPAIAVPHLEATEVPKKPPLLNDDEVQSLLMHDFKLVYEVKQIPDAVRKSFINVVDDGDEYSSSNPPTPPGNKELQEEWKSQEEKTSASSAGYG